MHSINNILGRDKISDSSVHNIIVIEAVRTSHLVNTQNDFKFQLSSKALICTEKFIVKHWEDLCNIRKMCETLGRSTKH